MLREMLSSYHQRCTSTVRKAPLMLKPPSRTNIPPAPITGQNVRVYQTSSQKPLAPYKERRD